VSQNEILAILEAETGSKSTIQKVDAEKLREDSYAGLGRGEFTHANIFGVVMASIFGQKNSARWGRGDDTESVGIPKKDLTKEIRKVLWMSPFEYVVFLELRSDPSLGRLELPVCSNVISPFHLWSKEGSFYGFGREFFETSA
jgi:hypothetical protein